MSSDIVDQLDSVICALENSSRLWSHASVVSDAATEIESLRDELEDALEQIRLLEERLS